MNILMQIKRIAHDYFSTCSLNTKSFYDGLRVQNFGIIIFVFRGSTIKFPPLRDCTVKTDA